MDYYLSSQSLCCCCFVKFYTHQEIHLVWSPKVLYRVRERSPRDLGNQIGHIHNFTCCFFKIHLGLFSHLHLGETSGLCSHVLRPQCYWPVHFSSLRFILCASASDDPWFYPVCGGNKWRTSSTPSSKIPAMLYILPSETNFRTHTK